MHVKKSTIILLLFFNACTPKNTPVKEGGYYHHDIYFGQNLSETYQKGIHDGCITAQGNYTKSHKLFNNTTEYHNGWFAGRNKCRHLLLTNDNRTK
jgi:hypothetical protein